MTVPAATPVPARPVDDAIIETGWGGWAHDHVAYGATRPRARVSRPTAQAIPTNAVTPVSFAAATFQKGTLWVVGTPTRITIADPGLYHVGAWARFALSPTGMRQLQFRRGGTASLAIQTSAPGNPIAVDLTVQTMVELQAGDYLEVTVYHERTVNCDVVPVEAWVTWEAPLVAASP